MSEMKIDKLMAEAVPGSIEATVANDALREHLSKVAPLYRDLVERITELRICGDTRKNEALITRIEELEGD